jgi:hypothetical protein
MYLQSPEDLIAVIYRKVIYTEYVFIIFTYIMYLKQITIDETRCICNPLCRSVSIPPKNDLRSITLFRTMYLPTIWGNS